MSAGWKKCCALIVNILLMIILIPLLFLLETTIRPLAIIWLVLRATDCSKFRQVLTLILAILLLPIMFFLFGIWAFIQIIINAFKYFAGPKKYEVKGQNITEFLWIKTHTLYKFLLDIFGAIRGAPIGTSLS